MRSRRTHKSTTVHTLPSGNEDNDLWGYYIEDSKGNTIIATVWEPTAKERKRIAAGENIRLLVWGKKTPPIAMDLTDEPLGKVPNDESDNPSPDMAD